MPNKIIKIKSLIPKKDTHKCLYLLNNYLFSDSWIDTLDLFNNRLYYSHLILNNGFLIKKLDDKIYEKLKLINIYLDHNYKLPKLEDLNTLFNKLSNPLNKKTFSSYHFKVVTDVNWRKRKVKRSVSPHIVYNRNG